MKIREEVLPPIIFDIVQTVINDKNPVHVRENACGRLEQIADACRIASENFRVQQSRNNIMKRNKR